MGILRLKNRARLCPVRLTLSIVAAVIILLQRALRGNRKTMVWLSGNLVRPILRALGQKSAQFDFSVAELLIAAAVLALLLYLWLFLDGIFRRGHLFRRLYRLVLTLLCAALLIYAGFCVLWGVYYYGDDFMDRSGLKNEAVSTEQLTAVTKFFAMLANESAGLVPRDTSGACLSDREQILERSGELYTGIEQDYPCLEGPPLRAKGVRLSKLLSYLDFTGFFFPFTGEANVNTDSPQAFFASTVAHELAHQRGVAKEQEANFVAVLVCLRSGDPDYVYSAALMAYTYLDQALTKADGAARQEIYAMLSEPVKRDFAVKNEYWQRFQTPVQSVSNTVYESFMYSYDQTMGLKSYGACVDLLVNYYYDYATRYFEALQAQEGIP